MLKIACIGVALCVQQVIALAQSATPAAAAIANDSTVSHCCQQFAGLIKMPLPTQLSEIPLNESLPTFDFGNGLQTYLFIELPKYSKPYHINITNLPQAPGIFNRTEYTQIPLLIETFGSDFQLKRRYLHTDMKKRGIGFDKTVFINPTNASEAFVLIYGDLKAPVEETTISEIGLSVSGMVGSISASLFLAAITGGAYILANPVLPDGTDRKISIKPNDKGMLILEPKGLPPK